MAKAKKPAKRRVDGWSNVFTKVGDLSRDKRLGAKYARNFVDELTAEEMWRGDDMAARIIETAPKVQLRNGFSVNVSELEKREPGKPYAERIDEDGTETKEAEEGMQARLDELSATMNMIKAGQYARAYGGAALLMGVDDGQANLELPVREATVKAVRYLVVLRPREIWPLRWNTNPLSGGYGQPTVYQVRREASGGVPSGPGFTVHASRIIRFDGIAVSKRATTENRGWGDSVLNRLVEPLSDFQLSFAAVPNLISDFAQGVYKLKGLAELFMSNEDDVVTKRIQNLDMARSVLRSLVIDAEDDFSRQQTPVAGLAELLDRVATRFAAAAQMPVSLLFGEAPAGLNATGDANTRWWYDDQEADRELTLRPKLNKLVRLIFLSSEGPTAGAEPEKWTVKFEPLWKATEAEVAEIRSKVATADKAYVDAGVLTPEEVAISRFGGDEWSMDTRIDMDARKVQAEAAEMEPEEPEPGDPPEPEDDEEAPAEDEA
ncbi:MAG: DUF1073 domain-containing protein [Phycisphaerales bacterium]